MVIKSFEEIVAWQKAEVLAVDIYNSMIQLKDYGFRDQLQRASVSIMNNIAEGFERQTNKELRQFLYISKGSCGEVRSMLRLAENLGYVNKEETTKLISQTTEISRLLAGFIKSI